MFLTKLPTICDAEYRYPVLTTDGAINSLKNLATLNPSETTNDAILKTSKLLQGHVRYWFNLWRPVPPFNVRIYSTTQTAILLLFRYGN